MIAPLVTNRALSLVSACVAVKRHYGIQRVRNTHNLRPNFCAVHNTTPGRLPLTGKSRSLLVPGCNVPIVLGKQGISKASSFLPESMYGVLSGTGFSSSDSSRLQSPRSLAALVVYIETRRSSLFSTESTNRSTPPLPKGNSFIPCRREEGTRFTCKCGSRRQISGVFCKNETPADVTGYY